MARGRHVVFWLGVLIALAWFAQTQSALNLDRSFASWLSGVRGDVPGSGLDGFMLGLSDVVRPLYIAPATLVAAALLWFKLRRWALLIPASFGSAIVVTYLLKWLLGRERPGAEFSLADLSSLGDAAFPSAHAAAVISSGMAVGQLAMPMLQRTARKLLDLVILALIGAVALSRVWVGAHWLTDVIGGLIAGLLGLGLALLVLKSFRRLPPAQRIRLG